MLFLVRLFGRCDSGETGRDPNLVEFALAFEQCLFAAFDLLAGLDYEVGVVVVDRVVQRDDGGAQFAPRPVRTVVQVPQSLGEVAAARALDPARRVQSLHHHRQFVEFPGLRLVVAALRLAGRVAHNPRAGALPSGVRCAVPDGRMHPPTWSR